ncbi:tRNA (guanine37-N1)-methyltransferase [Nematocida sp. ERTm5]|nr:tRNA (guanine37-N1)-methyltransferase [Nematocida sp. ERTm5]
MTEEAATEYLQSEEEKKVYNSIKNGEYSERIPCKILKITREEIKDALKTEKSILKMERVPRILDCSIFQEANKKRGIHIETDAMYKKTDNLWIVLDESSEKGHPATLVLSYEYFTHNELLKKAGICEKEYQSSYNRVGSIIHLNLKEESLKHKEIIAKTLLNKIKDCKTVIRKKSNIENVFRNIEIDHLQGVPSYKTVHRENGLKFSIDYDKVYWNSKLQKEREVLSKEIHKNQTVCDMFCGVGPFSILALYKGAEVWANDLNPASVANFKESIILNRKALGLEEVESAIWNEELEDRVHLYNLDAYEFLKEATETRKKMNVSSRFNHYILNLPELTLTFIKHFAALEKNTQPHKSGHATVHAYFFIRTGESATEKIEKEMNRKIEGTARLVRKVSPSKEMWVVSFTLLQ